MAKRKTKVQKIVDYISANGAKTSGEVMRHFRDRSMKVTYGEIATARRKATPQTKKPGKRVLAKAASAVSAPRGASADGSPSILAAVELIEKLGGVASAKQAIATVERIRSLPG